MTLLRRSHFKAIRPRVSDIEPRPKSFHRQYVNPFSIQRKARVCWIKPLQGIGRLRVLMSWAYMGWAWSCPAHVHQILPTPHLGCKLKCPHAAAVLQTPRRDLGLLPAFMAPSLQPGLFCLVGTEAPLTDQQLQELRPGKRTLVHSYAWGLDLLWVRYADHTVAGLAVLYCPLCWQNYIVACFLLRQNQVCLAQTH